MAAESLYSPPNKILYNELKQRFQEVPELVIETVMIQNGFVREKCIDALGRESHRYVANQFRSLQLTGMNAATQSQQTYNIHPGISNNGVIYPNSSLPYHDPLSAPVRPRDFEPFIGGNRGQPPSVPCPAYDQGPHSRTSSAPNMSHSISHPGIYPPDYPYSLGTNWHYSQQPPVPARPANFSQSFTEPSQATSYSPVQYPPGAYSPSQENHDPAGQVTNSPISTQRSHLPGSPATPPSQQPHSLPPNLAHVPSSSQVNMSAQYPVQFNRNWTIGGPADTQYEEALLYHQDERLQKLLQDLKQSKSALSLCKDRVLDMENKCLDRRRRRRSNSFPSVEDVQKMRDENRKLRVEIGVLFTQIDGQTQLGSFSAQLVSNPSQGQNFYSNIGKGQGGSIHGMNPTEASEGGDYQTSTNCQPRSMPPPRPPPPKYKPDREDRTSDDEAEKWNCSACTFLNHPSLDKCEVCEMPRINFFPSGVR